MNHLFAVAFFTILVFHYGQFTAPNGSRQVVSRDTQFGNLKECQICIYQILNIKALEWIVHYDPLPNAFKAA